MRCESSVRHITTSHCDIERIFKNFGSVLCAVAVQYGNCNLKVSMPRFIDGWEIDCGVSTNNFVGLERCTYKKYSTAAMVDSFNNPKIGQTFKFLARSISRHTTLRTVHLHVVEGFVIRSPMLILTATDNS